MHEVETMTFRGETPWHGLGTPLSDEGAKDWRKAYVEAGLDWGVELAPLCIAGTKNAPASIIGKEVNHKATVRTTDGSILGVVGPDYEPLQNDKAFEWFAPFLEEGLVEFEAAGSLRGGSRIWALGKILSTEMQAEVKPGDAVIRYVLLSHSHDGTLCVRIGFTDVRVVCMNTLRAAHDSELSKLIRIKHTKNVEANLAAVRDTMDLAAREFRATVEQYRLLNTKGVNPRDVLKYMVAVFEPKVEDGKLSKRAFDRMEEITRLAYEGVGNVGATVWDAFNGATEYLTWHRGKSEENRLNSGWFGDGAQTTQRALALAVDMATGKELEVEVAL